MNKIYISPLSFSQQRLWFLDKLLPHLGVYNVPFAFGMKGYLDMVALRYSVEQLIKKHEVLRSAIITDTNGIASQHTYSEVHIHIAKHSLHNSTKKELAQFLTKESQLPFSLDIAPLLRVTIIETAPQEYVVLFVIHHIAFDGWSGNIFFSEFEIFYNAFVTNQLDKIPYLIEPSTVQYSDFAQWQREWLKSKILNEQLSFWKEYLHGCVASIKLPYDYPRPKIPSYNGYHLYLKIKDSNILYKKLKMLSVKYNTTIYTVLLSVLYVLLYKYSNQEDITIGTNVNNRHYEGIEKVIGFFVNTLPVRNKVYNKLTFVQLLNEVHQSLVNIQQNQDTPFEQIVDSLNIERNINYNPLFQVLLDYKNASKKSMMLEGLITEELPIDLHLAKFDLCFSITNHGDDFQVIAQYSADLFSHQTLEKLLNSYEEILREVVSCDDQKSIAEINILTKEDKNWLLKNQGGKRWYNEDRTLIHILFEEQVKQNPDKIAVSFNNKSWTYNEINREANKLARCLTKSAVGTSRLIGISLDRSEKLIIAILAILKASYGYVPLDPEYPTNRLAFIVQDIGLNLVITESSVKDKLEVDLQNLEYIEIDNLDTKLESLDNLDIKNEDSTIAYIIHTSGSTGTPKGVIVEHKNVIPLVESGKDHFGFNSEDVWCLFHSVSFDFSVWEIWGSLLFGGKLVIASREEMRSPELLYQLLYKENVTIFNQTPSNFKQVVSYSNESKTNKLESLRLVIFGGEALEPQILRSWFDKYENSKPRLINMYGITETTVHVTYHELSKSYVESKNSIIGRPIDNAALYILNESKQRVPIGVSGEIYVGGTGVARGYLNREELTKEKFIENIYQTEEEAKESRNTKIYKTGDIGRYLADGNIEYLGRLDNQVKIRGFRIELGEIRYALENHEIVKEAIVIAKEDGSGGRRLYGYAILKELDVAGAISRQEVREELREYLKKELPFYMVPHFIVIMDKFPLGDSGKVDLQALPGEECEEAMRDLEKNGEPRTEIEKKLVDIWKRTLNVSHIGIYDNFFSSGGDSVISIRVIAEANKQNIYFSVADLFLYPTIATLLTQIHKSKTFNDKNSKLYINSNYESDVHYPLSKLQWGMIYHSEREKEEAIYQDSFSYWIEGDYNEEILKEILKEEIKIHTSLRTCFDLENYSEPLQIVDKEGLLRFETEDIRHLSEDKQRESILEWLEKEKLDKLDIRKLPLIRFYVHNCGKYFVLSLTMHHALADGWSVAYLITEILKCYDTKLSGREYEIHKPKAKYSNYITREREAIASEEHKRFWLNKVEASPFLRLPKLDETGQEAVGSKSDHRIKFDELDSKGSYELSKGLGVPLKTILLTVHLKVLSYIGNEVDVVSGIVTNGRLEEEDGEKLVGLFLNTIPIRVKLDKEESWEDLIKKVYSAELELMKYRRYPTIEIQKFNGGRALFEATFNYINYHIMGGLGAGERIKLKEITGFEQTNYGLTVNFFGGGEGDRYGVSLAYDPNILNETQIVKIGNYYKNALKSIVVDSKKRHSEICLLDLEEKDELLNKWNKTEKDYGKKKLIYEMFEEKVAENSNKVALICEGRETSYGRLNERANKIARYLQRYGVGKETKVGIMLPKKEELVVAILGILKAGGAYVPLDPEYPGERVRRILEDGKLSVIVTNSDLGNEMESGNAHLIMMDTEESKIEAESGENLTLNHDVNQLAYVLYTSGSSGLPKGVQISHANLGNYLYWAIETYPFKKAAFLYTTITFDFTLTSLFLPLVKGLQVYIGNWLDDKYELQNLQKCDLLKVTPSHIPFLVEKTLNFNLHINSLICGGENLYSSSIVNIIKNQSQHIFNEYGPTETTIGCAIYKLPNDITNNPVISIGNGISNTRLYILDEFMQPVILGVIGELYIAGDGVGKGYLNLPELTKERFLEPPHSNLPTEQSRLYKTGDLVRRLADGNIEYVSRKDDQVKVRGYRIELGEIEKILSKYNSIKQSCVVLNAKDNNNSLISYITIEEDLLIENSTVEIVSDVREYLEKHLPFYMVPERIIIIDEFPITLSGKIDKKALKEIAYEGRNIKEEYEEASTELEKTLVEIWKHLLGLDRVGITDNFFKLGGHSLLATQLVTEIRKKTDKEISLGDVFEYPTIKEIVLKVRDITENQTIQKVDRSKPIPLSFSQQRLWFLEKLMDTHSAYNVSLSYVLEGHLNFEALENSFRYLIQRHEALRTSIHTTEDQFKAVQVIHEKYDFSLDIFDIRNKKQENINNFVNSYVTRPFNLSTAPLFRVGLFTIKENQHVFVIVLHHIITDGWSNAIILKELGVIYSNFCCGNKLDLPILTKQYIDFSVMHNGLVENKFLENHIPFWKEHLKNIPPFIDLPFDYKRPKIPVFDNSYFHTHFDFNTSIQTRSAAAQHGVTIFTFLLSVLNVLLYRYTYQNQIVIGTVVSNRHYKDIENVIGSFVNNLAINTHISDSLTFKELLNQVARSITDTQKYQDVPFEYLVQNLGISRSVNIHPIFQVNFIYQDNELDTINLEGIKAKSFNIKRQLNRPEDLVFIASNDKNKISFSVIYSKSLFKKSTVKKIVKHLELLIQNICKDFSQQVSQIGFMADREKLSLVQIGKSTSFPTVTFYDLFKNSVLNHPEKLAVICENNRLSYRDLANKINHLSSSFINRGISKGTLICFIMERDISLLISLIASIKIGAVYIPIDKKISQIKFNDIISDLKDCVLVTLSKDLSHISKLANSDVRIYTFEDLMSDHNHSLTTGSLEKPNMNDLAYIIYTSGSTGKPKGAMVEHIGMVNHLEAKISDLKLSQHSIIAQTAVHTFDISIWQFLSALCVGGTTVIIKEHKAWNPKDLLPIIIKEKISVFETVPTNLNHIIDFLKEDSENLHKLPLKYLLLTGEALNSTTCKRWLKLYPHIPIINAYGPTECSDDVSHYFITNSKKLSGIVPISGVIQNTNLYILDKNLQIVPYGVVGELCVTGICVGRGYINNQEKTYTAFKEDIFSKNGGRLYRTGDFVRYTRKGEIEYLGRKDEQVKIRGNRIELGEVETSIMKSPLVKNCVVVAVPDKFGEKVLEAFIIKSDRCNRGSDSRIIGQIREYIKTELPQYMIPQLFSFLDQFPLNSSGKVDKIQLKNFQANKKILGSTNSEYCAPMSKLEKVLQSIWAKFLNLDNISIHDDFFNIGGNSLIIIRILAEIKKSIGKDISIITFFMYPTISQLVKKIESEDTHIEDPIFSIKKSESLNNVFLIHAAGGFAFPYIKLADSCNNFNIFGVNNPFVGKVKRPYKTINELASIYASFIKKHQSSGPYFLGGWSFGGVVALEIANQLVNTGFEVKTVVMIDSYSPALTSFKSQVSFIPFIKHEGISINSKEGRLLKRELENSRTILKNYKVPLYNGDTVLIKAEKLQHSDPKIYQDPYNGWTDYLQRLELHKVPLTHIELFDDNNISIIGKLLHNILINKL